MVKKPLDIAVLSDIHLGTVGCHALELLQYLNSIDPEMLILNGDFVDVWNFRKYYWPESHMMILRTLLTMTINGTDIYYLPAFDHELLVQKYHQIHKVDWHIFSPDCKKTYFDKNVLINPVGNLPFLESIKSSFGVITGAGFETCAEAMFWEKSCSPSRSPINTNSTVMPLRYVRWVCRRSEILMILLLILQKTESKILDLCK